MASLWSDGRRVPLGHRDDDAPSLARVLRAHWEALGRGEGLLVFLPRPGPAGNPSAATAGEIAAALARG